MLPGPCSPFAALGRDQAGVGQLADDLLDSRPLGLGGDQFVERGAALGVFGPLAGLRQTQEDAAADLQLPGRERNPSRTASARCSSAPWTLPMPL